MANMSYCRFQNTLRDLEDCFEALEELESLEELSTSEERAALEMGELITSILIEFERLNED